MCVCVYAICENNPATARSRKKNLNFRRVHWVYLFLSLSLSFMSSCVGFAHFCCCDCYRSQKRVSRNQIVSFPLNIHFPWFMIFGSFFSIFLIFLFALINFFVCVAIFQTKIWLYFCCCLFSRIVSFRFFFSSHAVYYYFSHEHAVAAVTVDASLSCWVGCGDADDVSVTVESAPILSRVLTLFSSLRFKLFWVLIASKDGLSNSSN